MRPRVGLDQAGHKIHQSSFAGSIRTYQTADSRRNRQVHAIDTENLTVSELLTCACSCPKRRRKN